MVHACAIYLVCFQSCLYTVLSNRNFAAIKDIHTYLDDNHDGNIDVTETIDFLNSELQYENTYQEKFLHKNLSKISVDSLWEKWQKNEVYQWKVSDVITWLKFVVKLPEYEQNFLKYSVDGPTMPSLATPKVRFVKDTLLIDKDLDRKKIYLCASDAILFGPPKEMKNFDESFLALKAVYDEKGNKNVMQSRPQNLLHAVRHTLLDDLWDIWQKSEAYSWSNDEVINWLIKTVQLPQYKQDFQLKQVTGKYIPRLIDDMYLKREFRIDNILHRNILTKSSADVILAGVPKMKNFDESFLALKAVYDEKGNKNAMQSRPQNLLHAVRHTLLDDLWDIWQKSEAYSWSNDEVINWLIKTVQLPQYKQDFHLKQVTGKYIPRLIDDMYLKREFRIDNILHRNILTKSSADVILAGVPNKLDKNFLAIKAVHEQLDDDKDGEIDLEESSEFMEEELNTPRSKRPSFLHVTDNHISVEELWVTWQKSEVYNWTTDDVVKWLRVVIGLPQYEKAFREKNISGKDIPRLTTEKFLINEIGVSDSIHRKKISLRCSDVILFGIPDDMPGSYFNDYVVLSIISLSTLFCLYAFREKKRTQNQIEQMTKDLEYLQLAEDNLKNMQNTLGVSESNVSENCDRENQLIEEIESVKREAELLRVEKYGKNQEDKIKLSMIEQELSEMRLHLINAQKQLYNAQIKSPKMLQKWLMVTYKKETKHFQQRKQIALNQMKEAKEACAKVSKTRRSMLGVLRLAHSESIDDVDEKILTARSALAEVTNDLQERQHRWKQIESLLNFEIVSGTYLNIPNDFSERKYSVERALADIASVATMSDCSMKINKDSEDDIEIEQINSCKVSEPAAEFFLQNDQYIANRTDVQKIYPVYAKTVSSHNSTDLKSRESEESINSQLERKISVSNCIRSFSNEFPDGDLSNQKADNFSRAPLFFKSGSSGNISSDMKLINSGKSITRVNTEPSNVLDERLQTIRVNLEKRSQSYSDMQKDSVQSFTGNGNFSESNGAISEYFASDYSISNSNIKTKKIKGISRLFRNSKK